MKGLKNEYFEIQLMFIGIIEDNKLFQKDYIKVKLLL